MQTWLTVGASSRSGSLTQEPFLLINPLCLLPAVKRAATLQYRQTMIAQSFTVKGLTHEEKNTICKLSCYFCDFFFLPCVFFICKVTLFQGLVNETDYATSCNTLQQKKNISVCIFFSFGNEKMRKSFADSETFPNYAASESTLCPSPNEPSPC